MNTPIAISQLRELLKHGGDSELGLFLAGYSLGSISDYLISSMIHPGQRSEFFIELAKQYPEDWAKANTELGK